MFTSQASGTEPRLATVRPAGQGHSRLEGRSLPPPPQTRAPFFPDIIFLQCPQERGKVCIDWRHSFTLCRLWRSAIRSFFFSLSFFYSTRTLSWWSVIICIYRRLKKRINKIWNIFWLVLILYNIYLTLLLNLFKNQLLHFLMWIGPILQLYCILIASTQ